MIYLNTLSFSLYLGNQAIRQKECESCVTDLHMVGYYSSHAERQKLQISEVWIRQNMPQLTCLNALWNVTQNITITYAEMV